MSCPAADIFRQAAAVTAQTQRRHGNVILLEDDCDIIVTGDLHGHRASLAKILALADLSNHPQRRLILQEVIHGPPDPVSGLDRSIELLLRYARLKTANPDRAYMLLSNHDLAQITGNEITKAGCGACKAFEAGVAGAFGDDAPEVLQAVREFLMSLPLAARCPNGVFIAHSVPSPLRMQAAGVEILDRPIERADMDRNHSVYDWVWGRGQTPQQLDELASRLGVTYFILGHRRVEAGYDTIGNRAVVINSDHEHGRLVRFRSSEPLTAENLMECLKPLAGITS